MQAAALDIQTPDEECEKAGFRELGDPTVTTACIFVRKHLVAKALLTAVVCGDLALGGASIEIDDYDDVGDYHELATVAGRYSWMAVVIAVIVIVVSNFFGRKVPESIKVDIVDVGVQTDVEQQQQRQRHLKIGARMWYCTPFGTKWHYRTNCPTLFDSTNVEGVALTTYPEVPDRCRMCSP